MTLFSLIEVREEFEGWTVQAVDETRLDEGLFEIELERYECVKRITLGATDMGWWVSDIYEVDGDRCVYREPRDVLTNVLRWMRDMHDSQEYKGSVQVVPVEYCEKEDALGYEAFTGRNWLLHPENLREDGVLSTVFESAESAEEFALMMWRMTMAFPLDDDEVDEWGDAWTWVICNA